MERGTAGLEREPGGRWSFLGLLLKDGGGLVEVMAASGKEDRWTHPEIMRRLTGEGPVMGRRAISL